MEKTLRVEGYDFSYRSIGDGFNFTLFFLHGFLGNCNDFQEAISLLSDQFYCLAVDLPGHGKTQVFGGEEYYTMEKIAQGLISFLQALNINQCALVGYSMGGRLALYLALHFPEYFSKVILESTSCGLKTQAERNQRIEHDFNLAKKLETESFLLFLTRWYAQPLFVSLKKHPHFEMMLESRLQSNPLELAKSLRNLSTGCQPSLWTKIQENLIPLLLLVGERDPKFISINAEIASLCDFAQLEIVSNCGHNIHRENVNQFVEKSRIFLLEDRTPPRKGMGFCY